MMELSKANKENAAPLLKERAGFHLISPVMFYFDRNRAMGL